MQPRNLLLPFLHLKVQPLELALLLDGLLKQESLSTLSLLALLEDACTLCLEALLLPHRSLQCRTLLVKLPTCPCLLLFPHLELCPQALDLTCLLSVVSLLLQLLLQPDELFLLLLSHPPALILNLAHPLDLHELDALSVGGTVNLLLQLRNLSLPLGLDGEDALSLLAEACGDELLLGILAAKHLKHVGLLHVLESLLLRLLDDAHNLLVLAPELLEGEASCLLPLQLGFALELKLLDVLLLQQLSALHLSLLLLHCAQLGRLIGWHLCLDR
mmetsp:Transcript_3614/g.9090  ORF Transcript_3614/g.9090 Transcript_3614/m.9090 type:complete len:273 (+) Transcript_3614:1062-1880(+)